MSLLQAPDVKKKFDYQVESETIRNFLSKTRGRPIRDSDLLDDFGNPEDEGADDEDDSMELDDGTGTRQKRQS